MPQALLALAGWSLFAFAGAYRWTLVPVMGAALVVAIARRPRPCPASHRVLDGLLLCCVGLTTLQLVPLPLAVRRLLSPASEQARSALRVGIEQAAWAPTSLDPAATAWSLATVVTLLILYWTARETFERDGGIRRTCRGIAWLGLALAVIVFVQRTASPRHIYGFWAPITRTAVPSPFGPYVNRNDFASWLLIAIPIVLGYALARVVSRAGERRLPALVESVFDARTALLVGSVLLMTAALVASLSRSGLAGIGTGLLLMGLLGRRRIGPAGSAAFAGAMVALLLFATQYTNMPALAFRLGDGLQSDIDGRLAIWRETWAMARDFLRAGIGVGAFENGMLLYQRSPRLLFFNHAHNEYLQILAEGGAMVAVPAAGAVLAGGWEATRRLRRDGSAVFWIRAGALSGLAALAVQSIWDTGLRMPANGVLFALAAAVATQAGRRPVDTPGGRAARRKPVARQVPAAEHDADLTQPGRAEWPLPPPSGVPAASES